MTTFNDPFGGSTVQPADVSYRAVALTADVTLVWPPQSETPTDFVSRIMDVTPTGAFAITMPDATAQSTGFDIIFLNKGAFTYTVKDSSGATLTTVAAGQVKYLYLTNNTTTAGVWGVLAFGATAAAPDAASLAGLGLAALGSVLQTSSPTVAISTNTSITAASRAKTYVWTGGAGTLTLPIVASVGSDFEFEIRNQGTGVLTIQPTGGELIDTAANIALQLNESCIVHSSTGSNWYTVGRGRNQQFSFTLLSKAVTGGTVTLTAVEASNVVQKYTGVLVSNCNVVLPGVVQVYYVSNQTSGAFTLTFKTAGVGSTVTVPSGQNAVLFCDGTNVINASTTVSGLSSLLLAQGSPTAPSIGYNGDSSTGIYQPVSSTVAITLGGTEYSRFTTTGLNSTAFVPTSATVPTLGMYGSADVRFAVGSTLKLTVGAAGAVFTGTVSGVTDFTNTGNTILGDAAADTLNVGAGGITKDANGNTGFNQSSVSNFGGYTTVEAKGKSGGGGGLFRSTSSDSVISADFSVVSAGASSMGSIGTFTVHPFSIVTNGLERVRTDASGRVGVNFFSAMSRLFTIGGQANPSMTIKSTVASGGAGSSAYYFGNSATDVTGYINYDHSDNSLQFGTSLVERARFDTSGHFVPGVTNTYTLGSAALRWSTVNGVLGNFSGTVTAAAFSGPLTGSASTLSPGRNINGVLFDGSVNITVTAAAGTLTGAALAAGVTSSSLTSVGTSFATTGTGTFNVASDGRIFGSALHNNAGAMTGTVNQYVGSGTYTPTLTGVSNVTTSSVTGVWKWVRVGNVVRVTGYLNMAATATSTTTQLAMTLPIASNLTQAQGADLTGQAVGLGASGPTGPTTRILGDAATDRAVATWTDVGATFSQVWTVDFTYEVL